jgi:hypothetical protein
MRTLADTFALYFTGLRAALATTMSMPKDHIAFLEMVWRYVLGLSGRLDRLVARWKNGTLPRPTAPRPGRARKAHAPPAFRLPRGRKWLIRRMPGTGIGAFGGQLEYLLANDAELAAFLEAAPQARRLLGPVCRMFGVTMPAPPAAPAATPAIPQSTSEPAGDPPREPPRLVESPSPSPAAAPTPPLVFSSP